MVDRNEPSEHPSNQSRPPGSAIRALVRGRVQGVGFRYTTRETARRLGISGWVRNQPDGSVEVWGQGDAESLAAFRGFLERGPPGARVTSLEVEPAIPDPRLEGFVVTY